MREAFASATGAPLCVKPGWSLPRRLASLCILASRVLALNSPSGYAVRPAHLSDIGPPRLIQGQAGAGNRMEGAQT